MIDLVIGGTGVAQGLVMTSWFSSKALRDLLADERGAVSTEYMVITALSVLLAIAVGASAAAVQSARQRSEELMRENLP